MALQHYLRGSCSCGRNRYVVEIPPTSSESARVFFDNTAASRRHQAAPLTAWLRVPLSWYHSTTVAFFPDETHSSIRRTYSLSSAGHERRQFCGYCGTQLSTWDELARERAEFISLTLGSLVDEDLESLQDLGLLPTEEEEEVEFTGNADAPDKVVTTSRDIERPRGIPWFEELVDDSRLGRIKRRRGGETSQDGNTTVEWEVIEMEDGSIQESTTSTKRKIAEVDAESDVHMRQG